MQLKEHELIKFYVLRSGSWIGPSITGRVFWRATMTAVTVYIFCKWLLIIVILVNELAESNKVINK